MRRSRAARTPLRPFGSLRSQEQVDENARSNHLGFTGEFLDDTAGQYNLRAREYDPAFGQFLQVDPVASNSSAYVYAGGNPTAFTDPSGMRRGSRGIGMQIPQATLFERAWLVRKTGGPDYHFHRSLQAGEISVYACADNVYGMRVIAWCHMSDFGNLDDYGWANGYDLFVNTRAVWADDGNSARPWQKGYWLFCQYKHEITHVWDHAYLGKNFGEKFADKREAACLSRYDRMARPRWYVDPSVRANRR